MPEELQEFEYTGESQDVANAERAEELSNSRFFDPYLSCNNEQFEQQVGELFGELMEWYSSSRSSLRGFRREENLNMLRRIVCNLAFNSTVCFEKYLAITFGRNYYSINNRYEPSFGSYGCSVRVRDFLISNDYIDRHTGFNNHEQGRSYYSRIKARENLANRFTNLSMFHFTSERFREPIILRNDAKKDIEYSDDEHSSIPFIRQDIEHINGLISNSWIDLYVTDDIYFELCNQTDKFLDLTRNRLCRIFNNSSFNEGGRFFRGWWLEIPSEYRKFITINGENTVELDYSGMNVALIYAENRLLMPEYDVYEVEGFRREDSKTAFNILLNTSSRNTAINALERDTDIQLNREDIQNLLIKLEELHEPIRHTYYTNVASRLQNTESRIANLLMLRMAENNIVTLPIHDGFIVQSRHERTLRDQMTRCFTTITDGNTRVPEAIVEVNNSDNINFDEHFSRHSSYYDRRHYHDSLSED
jgi:hypothetical protein